ncbi:MAG: Na+/H+ antiporter NhaC family protein [Solitalea-like symbiont of Acarus siro]
MDNKKPDFWSLLPLIIFIIVYLGGSIIIGDFYKIPVHVAFLVAAFFAVVMNKNSSVNERIKNFTKGMGHPNIMLMCLIFILAGAFSQLCKDIGAIKVVVDLGLATLPKSLFIVSLFMIACCVSLSIGTSVGTINVLTPIAIALSSEANISLAMILGAVISGSMFGDNLSMISDTTIVASRTQNSKLSDKFKANILIALPAAIVTILIYIFISSDISYSQQTIDIKTIPWIKAIPYLIVLMTAIAGVNVIIVLSLGCCIAVTMGILTNDLTIWSAMQSISKGFENMALLSVLCMIIGGVMQLIKLNGGIIFLIQFISKYVKGSKTAELGIAALVIIVDICTANNTIAILLTGDIVKHISNKFNISAARSASLLDTFSCFAQGLIPYGAQILTAVALTGFIISPIEIMKYQFYTFLLGASALMFILFKKNRNYLR